MLRELMMTAFYRTPFQAELSAIRLGVRLIQAEFFTILSGVRLIQAELSAIRSGVRLIQAEFFTIRSGMRLIQAELSAIRLGVRLIQAEFFAIRSGLRLIQAEFFTIRSGVRLIQAEFFAIRSGVRLYCAWYQWVNVSRNAGQIVVEEATPSGVALSITPSKRSAVRGCTLRGQFNTVGVALKANGNPCRGYAPETPIYPVSIDMYALTGKRSRNDDCRLRKMN
jgi:hypothetical protein